jgi:hypothetical protein
VKSALGIPVDLVGLGLCRERTASGHRIARVDGEVEQDLFELAHVRANGDRRRRRHDVQPDLLADHALQASRRPYGPPRRHPRSRA